MSASMALLDLKVCVLYFCNIKPTRAECTIALIIGFIHEFFDQNPLSLLGIIMTRDGQAEILSPLSSSPSAHISVLRDPSIREPRGEASLQNGLELARLSLRYLIFRYFMPSHVPLHCMREVLLISSSLTSCDPSDIFQTLASLVSSKIRVSTIGLAAQVSLCARLAKETTGTYSIILNQGHFRELLWKAVAPPAASINNSGTSCVLMGFPRTYRVLHGVLCACHHNIVQKIHECPRCESSVCGMRTHKLIDISRHTLRLSDMRANTCK